MKITRRMRSKHTNVPVRMSNSEEKREALRLEIAAHFTQGRSPEEIGRALQISTKMVHQLLKELAQDEMEVLNDIPYQRFLQLKKVQALSSSRHEVACDGDNVAMNQMIKLIPLENKLLGLDDTRSIQEVVLNGVIKQETTTTVTSELGDKAAAAIDKFLAKEASEAIDVPNTHKPANDMGELMSKLAQNNSQFEAMNDDGIVDAEIIEE